MKTLGTIIVALLLIVFGAFAHYAYVNGMLSGIIPSPTETEEAIETGTETEEEELCAQVITPARNPETGEIREFPTPCDVPDGWETIQNDIPSLELDLI